MIYANEKKTSGPGTDLQEVLLNVLMNAKTAVDISSGWFAGDFFLQKRVLAHLDLTNMLWTIGYVRSVKADNKNIGNPD